MSENQTTKFIRKATGVGAINIADRVVTVGLGVFLARTLEPSGYGAYSFIMSQVILATILVKLGLPELILRDFAASRGNNNNILPIRLLRLAVFLSFFASSFIIITGLLFLTFLYDGPNSAKYAFGLLMIAPLAIFEIYAGVLRGLNYALTFQIVSTLGLTLTMLLTCVAYGHFFDNFAAVDVLLIRATVLCAFCAGTVFLVSYLIKSRIRSLPFNLLEEPKPPILDTLRTSASFLLIGVLHIVFVTIDQLMLGYLIDERSVAIFKVASEGAQIVAFAYVAANAVLAPEYSRIFSSKNLELLERTAQQSAAIVLIVAFPIVLVLTIFSSPIITLVFGSSYADSACPLVFLALGHFLALFFGDPLYILNMTGHHKISMRLTLLAVMTNIILNAVAIPIFGIVGAAVATSFSFVLLRLMAYMYVRSLLKIECSAISGLNFISKLGIRHG